MVVHSRSRWSAWSWREGPVEPTREHFELRFGSVDDSDWASWVPVARVGLPTGQRFWVQFLITPSDPEHRRMIDDVRAELDFYLVEKRERNPWAYALYHCGTSANLYSSVHWSFVTGARSHARRSAGQPKRGDAASQAKVLRKSSERWWRKPLVATPTGPIPAELAILRSELQPGEAGAWLNSRSRASGVIDIDRSAIGAFRTVRVALPDFVTELLQSIHGVTGSSKGAPDLVLWCRDTRCVRLIEVKHRNHDRSSNEQIEFSREAKKRNVDTSIVEWEFEAGSEEAG